MESLKEPTNDNLCIIIYLIKSSKINNMLSTLKLTSRTPLGKDEIKKVKTIIELLLDSNDSF